MFIPSDKQVAIRDAHALDLLVVAPAGCGKTEALALRVYGLLQRGEIEVPQKILVTTFSNRARDSIKDRLASYLTPGAMRDRITVMNFHGLSARIIKAHGNVIGLRDELILPDSDWISEQLNQQDIPWVQRDEINQILRNIKQQPLDDAQVEEELESYGNSTALDLERRRKSEGRLTYDDLPRLAELILSNEAVAELFSSHFGAIMVDEFQDLTPQQLRIINKIGYKRTTYAGDLAQGIYSFAGAQPAQINQAIRQECSTVIEFSESHRSSPAVLHMVNALAPLTSGQRLTSAHPASWPSGGLSGAVAHTTANNEAAWIVEAVRYIRVHAPQHRIGILARTRNRRRFVDAAFEASEIPCWRWSGGLLDTETAKLVKAMLAHFDLDDYINAVDKLSFLREAINFEAIVDTATRENVADALGWVQEQLSGSASPRDIRSRIQIGDADTLLTSPGVHLLSAHVGKGQQFDWVIVVGLEDGVVPDFRATTEEQELEEARVLSVMISRARHGVILSRADNVPTVEGKDYPRAPSPFCDQINTARPLNMSSIIEWFNKADWSAINNK